MKSLFKRVKSAIIGLGLLGMISGANMPINAEEISSNLNEKNYNYTESINHTNYLNKSENLEGILEPSPYFSIENYAKKTEQKTKPKKSTFFGFGTYNLGLVTYLPCKPLEGTYQPGSAYMISAQPYDLSYSLGIGIDYKILPNVGIFLDGGFSSWKKLIAEKGGYGVGAWIWEQSGYEDARVGPFPMDTYYYMDATSLRAGARYIFSKGKFEPWAGAGYGLYAWQATIGNRQEEKKYGQNSGLVGGLTFLGGVDLNFNDFVLRVFGEFASPVANPKIENLFRDGWTFENTGGEHILGHYRFGVAIGFKNF